MKTKRLQENYENSKKDLIITIFLGLIGTHRFLKKDYKMGLVFLCTLGIFGFGWIRDIVISFKKVLDDCSKLKNAPKKDTKNISSSKSKVESKSKPKKTTSTKSQEKNTKTDSINLNEKRKEIANSINTISIWEKGTPAQQDFADKLVERFSNRIAKYLCWAVRDKLISDDDLNSLTSAFQYSMCKIDDSRWWCDKKNMSEKFIAVSLLDDEKLVKTIKDIYTHYTK